MHEHGISARLPQSIGGSGETKRWTGTGIPHAYILRYFSYESLKRNLSYK